MNTNGTDKYKLTLYTTRKVVNLLKKKKYNLSEIADSAFMTTLEVESMEEVEILDKIEDINNQFKTLELKKKLLVNELESLRKRLKRRESGKIRDQAFLSIVKELRDTKGISSENLSTKAEILGITEDELLNKAMQHLGMKPP